MEFREANRYALRCIGRQDLTLKPKQEASSLSPPRWLGRLRLVPHWLLQAIVLYPLEFAALHV